MLSLKEVVEDVEVCRVMGMEENKKHEVFLKAGEQVVFRKGGCAVTLKRKGGRTHW